MKQHKTSREQYSRLIGYDFGGYVYDGAYWNTETGKKQYEFSQYKDNARVGGFITDYAGFRATIDQYDYPRN